MPKNPEHKKFMSDYDGLTSDEARRPSGDMSGMRLTESRASYFKRRKQAKAAFINPVDGARVTVRDSNPETDDRNYGLVDEKNSPKPISLSETLEKAKARGKKSK